MKVRNQIAHAQCTVVLETLNPKPTQQRFGVQSDLAAGRSRFLDLWWFRA